MLKEILGKIKFYIMIIMREGLMNIQLNISFDFNILKLFICSLLLKSYKIIIHYYIIIYFS